MRIGRPFLFWLTILLPTANFAAAPLHAQNAPAAGVEALAQQAADLWMQIRRSALGSQELADAQAKLLGLVRGLEERQRVPVATALMEWGADDATNITPIKEFFGPDAFPAAQLKPILADPTRTWAERVLVRTYFKFLHPEHETTLTETNRVELVGLLADRLTKLAGQDIVPYGEQRLLSHMLQAALSRYARTDDPPPVVAELIRAMELYAARPRADDSLNVSITAWLAMRADPVASIDSQRGAMLAMGHWDPVVRQKASLFLGMEIRKNPALGDRVMEQFADPRDEVRASAARVFLFALSYQPKKVVSKMVDILRRDRGVSVQRAASETLIAHCDQAAESVPALLGALIQPLPGPGPERLPGPKRATSLLTTLSYLVTDETPEDQKSRLFEIALDKLAFAPHGALRALEALGPAAKPAIPRIKRYRDTQADRFVKNEINLHVLPAIDPDAVE